jgi:hypothetical protein
MRERIEWVEPIEVAHELRQRNDSELHALYERIACWALGLGVGGVFATLAIAPHSAYLVGLGVVGVAVPLCAPVALVPLLARRGWTKPRERLCSIGVGHDLLWKHAQSFEIADHPTLPGIRSLSLYTGDSHLMACFSFRQGQIDEAELRALVQSRLAEPIAQRLMKRVKM